MLILLSPDQPDLGELTQLADEMERESPHEGSHFGLMEHNLRTAIVDLARTLAKASVR